MKLRNRMLHLLRSSAAKYLIVGGLAFTTEYLTFFVLYNTKVNLIFATSVSFLCGLVVSFIGNKAWAFSVAVPVNGMRKQVFYYALLAAANLFTANILVQALKASGIDPKIGKLLTMLAIPVWNYFIFKKLIFASKINA